MLFYTTPLVIISNHWERVSTCLKVTDVDGDPALAVSRPLWWPTCPCLLMRLCYLRMIFCDLLAEFQTMSCAGRGCGSCEVTVPTW